MDSGAHRALLAAMDSRDEEDAARRLLVDVAWEPLDQLEREARRLKSARENIN